MMNELVELIRQDMKPALGVTEPAAIALACAKARSLTEEPVESLTLRVNSGIDKNAFTCGIPGTSEVGNDYSAALGIVCGDPEKGLQQQTAGKQERQDRCYRDRIVYPGWRSRSHSAGKNARLH